MGAFDDYDSYDGLGLAALVRDREIKAEDVLAAAIERVEARDGQVNAVVTRLYDLGEAAIAAGLPDGPFTGVPYLLKELGSSLGGVPTSRGCRFFADVTPPQDSENVKRLKRAGLVLFGKTNTCELGLSRTCEPAYHGPTRNPWDRARISGGSSGGAAAAVGARMLAMAHASDGFGSIRAPAACCGLVGLKPTRARGTLAPYAGEGLGGLAVEHAVTLSVRDSAALLDVTSGPGEGDPYAAPARPFLSEVGADPGRLKIAFTSLAPNGTAVEAEPLRVLDETAALCAELGHHVEQANPEIDGAAVQPTFRTSIAVNAAVSLASHPSGRAPGPDEIETVTRKTAEIGRAIPAPEYMAAIHTAHRLGRQMAAFHRDWDVLLTPGLAVPPVKLGWLDMMMDDVAAYWDRVAAFSPFTVWFNLTGQPAIMLPLGYMASGLPIAVQLVARYGDEATLFRLAAQLEAARPWIDRRPEIAETT